MAEIKKEKYFYGLGRRKEATAQVRLYVGNSASIVNEKKLNDYFGNENVVRAALAPLASTGNIDKTYVTVVVKGGGVTGQAEAVSLGIARALIEYDEGYKTVLKKAGFLTRDPREKERKKPGLKRARKAPQFSKR